MRNEFPRRWMYPYYHTQGRIAAVLATRMGESFSRFRCVEGRVLSRPEVGVPSTPLPTADCGKFQFFRLNLEEPLGTNQAAYCCYTRQRQVEGRRSLIANGSQRETLHLHRKAAAIAIVGGLYTAILERAAFQ